MKRLPAISTSETLIADRNDRPVNVILRTDVDWPSLEISDNQTVVDWWPFALATATLPDVSDNVPA